MLGNISQPVTRYQFKEQDAFVSGTEAAGKIQR